MPIARTFATSFSSDKEGGSSNGGDGGGGELASILQALFRESIFIKSTKQNRFMSILCTTQLSLTRGCKDTVDTLILGIGTVVAFAGDS
ncbi:hypothetical protein M0804_014444 [Polistes exclamans]|nr:hypothetical protein M0804_014446 [Polistes exclamans]KAI4475214.1 hypothetical protein M0804_014444 [Polistes exclamans]